MGILYDLNEVADFLMNKAAKEHKNMEEVIGEAVAKLTDDEEHDA